MKELYDIDMEKTQHPKLLENEDAKIIEIAMDVGFDSFSYFISMFKRYMKCTPSQYRKSKSL